MKKMYKLLLNLTILMSLFLPINEMVFAKVYVKSYYRKNGTFVNSHTRSNPYSGYSYTPIISKKYINKSTYDPNNSYLNYNTDKTTSIKNNTEKNKINSVIDPLSNEIPLESLEILASDTTNTDIKNKWILLTESYSDKFYVLPNSLEKYSHGDQINKPVITIKFTGQRKDKKLSWQGVRYQKVMFNCTLNEFTYVADSIIDSNGMVIRNWTLKSNELPKWFDINSDPFIKLLPRYYEIC